MDTLKEHLEINEEEAALADHCQPLPPTAPQTQFLVIRGTPEVRAKLDLRTLQIYSGDTTRLVESQEGPWYWLLIDLATVSAATVQNLRDAVGEDIWADAPASLWDLGHPLNELWKHKGSLDLR